jgi:hypothetical protein
LSIRVIFRFPLATQQAIIAEIEAEQATLARVWGEELEH